MLQIHLPLKFIQQNQTPSTVPTGHAHFLETSIQAKEELIQKMPQFVDDEFINIFSTPGYTQKEGIDFEGTLCTVAGWKLYDCFIAYAAHKSFTVYQMGSFINKHFFMDLLKKEKGYVNLPDGFVDPISS
ncbi:hypothetical protein Tco_1292345 [Tanacetum coccineum]